MTPTKRGQVRYTVYDRGRLASLVERLVEQFGAGGLNAAAKALRITQPTLHRLKESGSGAVTHDTMAKLEEGLLTLGRRFQRWLLLSVMTPGGWFLFRRGWSGWCSERQTRLLNRRGVVWSKLDGKVPHRRKAPWKKHSLGIDLKSTRNAFEDELPDLWERLTKASLEAGLPGFRLGVAITRVVEPLAEYGSSAFIEPRWHELSPKDRRAFVFHGVAREKILFKYLRPEARANLLAEGKDPMDIASVLNEFSDSMKKSGA